MVIIHFRHFAYTMDINHLNTFNLVGPYSYFLSLKAVPRLYFYSILEIATSSVAEYKIFFFIVQCSCIGYCKKKYKKPQSFWPF